MKKMVIIISIIIIVALSTLIIIEKIQYNNSEKNKLPEEVKQKLKKLNDIHNKIDFFNMKKLDEYIAYKENNPDMKDEMIIVYVNIGLNRPFYTDIAAVSDQASTTTLVNKYYYLDSSYEPSDLETINSKYSNGKKELQQVARIAFENLAESAKKEGYNIYAVSTYRSYSYQNNLYNNYASKDGIDKADTYSARAGHSEHQTGLAVDVANDTKGYTKFGDTKEFIWMQENAHKYGYILRYTKETEWITGYINEPWHYRYVGVEIATYIHNNPMTYEEYYVRFLDSKQNK